MSTDLLVRLLDRLPEVRQLQGSLAAERERSTQERQPPSELAFATLRTAWLTAPSAVPAVLVADLVAECWTVLAEEALAQGALGRSALALGLAEIALARGSGDPYLAGHLHLVWALHHRAGGNVHQARKYLHHRIAQLQHLDDPKALAEAELWLHLFEREQGRQAEAQAAFDRAGTRLGEEERSAALAQLVARRNRLPAEPASGPAPPTEPGPSADEHPPSAPDAVIVTKPRRGREDVS